MLPRIHRITAGADYRLVQRKGRRVPTDFFVLSVMTTNEETPARFGFVVGKSVGNAVVRNRVRRQLRNLAVETVRDKACGLDVVVRVLPAAAGADFVALGTSWKNALEARRP